ncbi:hypothetical protein JNUCC0626_35970 [Lentzea sp. JNUCC 0626]|uniref:hypothetical protein n=1 Tax=Lentzea sp. JNUCC 0626 TaxID=3367513 RepID=UPI00374A3C7A
MTSPKESGTPRTITVGYWLVLVGAALCVVAGVFQFAARQALVDAIKSRNTDPALTTEMIESSATVTLGAVMVVTAVVAALMVWFAGKVKAGTRKSRTGLMIAVLINLFFQMVGNGYALVPALIAMSGLVLFYFRQSSDFLTEREQLA